MTKQTLNGTWTMEKAGEDWSIPVEVPGSVISGLVAAGKIEDPFYRENEYETRELFWSDYLFSRKFSVGPDVIKQDAVTLVCEGLDTIAEISLNGHMVAKTSDMHRTYRIPIKEYLKEGENEICIRFLSVLKYIQNYEYSEHRRPTFISSGVMAGNELVRKAHSMFGWDWGPQLVDAGIFRDIYLESYSVVRISDVRIHQEHHEDGSVDVCTTVQLQTPNGEKAPETAVTVTLTDPENGESIMQKAIKKEGDSYEAVITMEHPKLWWPNGYGEHPLYCLTVSQGEERIEKTIGIRTLTISQEKDAWGSEFAFQVNGVKIFTRGGNYIPDDAIYPHITTGKIDYILRSCVRANFNCIRVWGGGFFPSDAFFDLCDRYGLIVWQDLMFACNVYDVNDVFVENVREETKDNVRRIRHHACLGLWCGNNEIESAWHHWGDFQTQGAYLRADYIRLFEEILPRVVKENDPDTFYWRSSPSSGGCFDEPDDENRGDTHYWDVWHGQKPFSDYQKYYFRFCSEFGFQSFPSFKTVETFTKEEDRNIFSKVMESHQKNDAANGKMLYYLSENLRYPKDFSSLLYATQVLQGMAIKSGVDHWRRNRGRCMGALYWQINDNWPVASWSGIDYFGRWKALHYMAVKFYAPIAGSLRVVDGRVEFYLVNETDRPVSFSGKLMRKDFFCVEQEKQELAGTLKPYEVSLVASMDVAEPYTSFVEANVYCGDCRVKEVEVMAPLKHLELPKPNYEITVEETPDSYELCVKADCYAPFVELDFAQADAIFSDNYFHLTGDEEHVTIAKSDIWNGTFADASDAEKDIRVRSLRDSY